jgi:hypothetical protein
MSYEIQKLKYKDFNNDLVNYFVEELKNLVEGISEDDEGDDKDFQFDLQKDYEDKGIGFTFKGNLNVYVWNNRKHYSVTSVLFDCRIIATNDECSYLIIETHEDSEIDYFDGHLDGILNSHSLGGAKDAMLNINTCAFGDCNKTVSKNSSYYCIEHAYQRKMEGY